MIKLATQVRKQPETGVSSLTRSQKCRLNNELSRAETPWQKQAIRTEFMARLNSIPSSNKTDENKQNPNQTSVTSYLPEKLRDILKQDWACVATHTNDTNNTVILILPSEAIRGHEPDFAEPNSNTVKNTTDDFEGFFKLTLSDAARLEESHGISHDKRTKLRTALTNAYNTNMADHESKVIADDAPLTKRKQSNTIHLGYK